MKELNSFIFRLNQVRLKQKLMSLFVQEQDKSNNQYRKYNVFGAGLFFFPLKNNVTLELSNGS